MFDDLIDDSQPFTVVSEDIENDESAARVQLRVTDTKKWNKLVSKILRMQLREDVDEETYGLAINKQFYLEEESRKPTFCWVLIIWGDILDAASDLEELLAKPVARPIQPPKNLMDGTRVRTLKRERRATDDGSVTITTVPIPHHRKDRNMEDPNKVIDREFRGKKATVARKLRGAGGGPRMSDAGGESL